MACASDQGLDRPYAGRLRHRSGAGGGRDWAIAHGFLPGCLGITQLDPAFRSPGVDGDGTPPRSGAMMINAFGFGGINCSLLLGAPGMTAGPSRRRSSSIAVLGPGLPGWGASRAILAGEGALAGRPTIALPAHLPSCRPPSAAAPAQSSGCALAVATEAVAASGHRPAPIFASCSAAAMATRSDGGRDPGCGERTPGGFVSPTQFHNSVHNAAAGYWSIGVGSTAARPACIACDDWTFAASLMKAVAECHVGTASRCCSASMTG